MDRPDTFTEVAAVRGDIEVPRLCVSDALRGMQRAVRLFTPALLVTHGGFDRDPVREFDARFPAERPDDRPFIIDLQHDNEFFFRGLGVVGLSCHKRPPNWDKRLYAISAPRADECFEFLNGIAFSDPKRAYYASVLSYDLRIQDPTSKIDTALDVKVFGVMSNTFIAYLSNDYEKPRALKVPMTANLNIGTIVPLDGLLINPFDDDPLKMRDQ